MNRRGARRGVAVAAQLEGEVHAAPAAVDRVEGPPGLKVHFRKAFEDSAREEARNGAGGREQSLVPRITGRSGARAHERRRRARAEQRVHGAARVAQLLQRLLAREAREERRHVVEESLARLVENRLEVYDRVAGALVHAERLAEKLARAHQEQRHRARRRRAAVAVHSRRALEQRPDRRRVKEEMSKQKNERSEQENKRSKQKK